MGPVELIMREAELEYRVPMYGDTIRVTPYNSDNVPRVAVARHAKGFQMLFREGLPHKEKTTFLQYGPERLFSLSDDEISMLSIATGQAYRVVDCGWYCITRIPGRSEFPDVVRRDGRYVVERDGREVAEAWSCETGARAAEVEVNTLEEYRRRGYARQVVAAWAYDTRREGKTAYYSHLTTNMASRALVANLGGVWFADMREYFLATLPAI
jgi:predicted GNAT family acetyltransferase